MAGWWFRLDEGFVEHKKVMDLSDRAFRLHVAGLCYATRNLTDGILSARAVKVVCALTAATRRHVVELRDGGLWLVRDDGYEIKDYLAYNPDAKTVKEIREARREAGRIGGIRSGEARRKAAEAKNEANASASALNHVTNTEDQKPDRHLEPVGILVDKDKHEAARELYEAIKPEHRDDGTWVVLKARANDPLVTVGDISGLKPGLPSATNQAKWACEALARIARERAGKADAA